MFSSAVANSVRPAPRLHLLVSIEQKVVEILNATPSSSASEAKSSSLRIDETAAASSQSYALPKNLQSAIRYLDDDQLERLLAAVLAEQRRRGKKVPVSDKSPRKALVKVAAPPLPQGKLNAIRAAFKAGFTPSRIARQFRISQSDVKKALASDEMKR